MGRPTTADAEPSLAAVKNYHGSQVGWCRGNDGDREAEAPEIALPDVTVEPRTVPASALWGDQGNVVSACGAMLLALVAGG